MKNDLTPFEKDLLKIINLNNRTRYNYKNFMEWNTNKETVEKNLREGEKMRQDRVNHRNSLTLAYQLGFYIGEQIVYRHLPTLSIDHIQTNKNISVTCAEGDEFRRLDEIWFNKRMSIKGTEEEKKKATELEWQDVTHLRKQLQDKYLPKTVKCYFSLLNIKEEDMKEFKEGIINSLWNCDCCHYSLKPSDISVVATDDGYFTIITLKRD